MNLNKCTDGRSMAHWNIEGISIEEINIKRGIRQRYIYCRKSRLAKVTNEISREKRIISRHIQHKENKFMVVSKKKINNVCTQINSEQIEEVEKNLGICKWESEKCLYGNENKTNHWIPQHE